MNKTLFFSAAFPCPSQCNTGSVVNGGGMSNGGGYVMVLSSILSKKAWFLLLLGRGTLNDAHLTTVGGAWGPFVLLEIKPGLVVWKEVPHSQYY